MSLNEVHISSLVVHAVPQHLNAIKRQIEAFDGAEIYGESAAGKLVVVIETRNQGYITDTIDAINQLDHVLSTALVFHQIEHDLDDEISAADKNTEV
ncbi:chaperone NapD [Oceanisphaera arctica]|jgi:periplasmic nitrate reductase NapD|uniref:Chaperone NapD n=1 Tax=Oceanisphaera arctica TaxID=641510 RepID=A0A2P5TN11_9GAMM|nr:chaperone NapD [Oceanisphaera arctica]PPL16902.1 nitrate reductase [Oceanisphaera arctica]GHA19343.1 nitrate reductase [Oceanisphaera arctica]